MICTSHLKLLKVVDRGERKGLGWAGLGGAGRGGACG